MKTRLIIDNADTLSLLMSARPLVTASTILREEARILNHTAALTEEVVAAETTGNHKGIIDARARLAKAVANGRALSLSK